MSTATWHDVGRALLGRWPAQVSGWGEEGIAAYIAELQADGLTPDRALVALRSHRPDGGRDFPPSVAAVSEIARSDPSQPTFDEFLTLTRRALHAWNLPVRGSYSSEVEMLGVRDRNVLDRAETLHPLVAAFIARHGVRRLQDEVGELDGQHGGIRRRELEAAWREHCEALAGREVASIASGRGARGLASFDPLAALLGPGSVSVRGRVVALERGEEA